MKRENYIMFFKKYKEIFKLKALLDEADIPYELSIANPESEYVGGFHLCYPKFDHISNGFKERVCSVIEHGGSYGNEEDLLEIMGLLTAEEEKEGSVRGYLTAENVYKRIRKHYLENS